VLKVVYNISIHAYRLLIAFFALFQQKARLFRQGRRQYSYLDIPRKNGAKRIWVHASSLGEFEQGRPLIEMLKNRNPNVQIVLTFFSPSGFEVKKAYDQADHVTYIPLDTKSRAQRFIEHIDPDLAVIIKYEFWLNHLDACFRKQIPVVYLSAIFKEQHVYFHRARSLYLPYFKRISHFFVQDELSARLLQKEGIDQYTIAGDTRFDRVIQIAESSRSITEVEQFSGEKPVFVFGSTWPSDIEKVVPLIEKIKSDYKVIIAPHNIGEDAVQELMKTFPDAARYTRFQSNDSEKDILIIDNMGMLSSVYRYARFAFVGGAFRGALHNTIEAAVYGIPVFFGRHAKNKKFNEAIALLEGGGAFDFADSEELLSKWSELQDEEKYTKSATFNKEFVAKNKGATQKAYDYLIKKIEG
jgi:3-deoxy-D-manno-octulosonic-acid transferase